jgi:hypothetical protein
VCTNDSLNAVLIAVTCTVIALKCRHCPGFYDELVGVEISTSDGLTLPFGTIAEIIYTFLTW